MEFNISEDILGKLISGLTIKWDKHRLSKVRLNELLDQRIIIPDERLKVR